ncbi:MAG: RNA polymerase sigma factor [Ignavibacteriaceae bacterium]
MVKLIRYKLLIKQYKNRVYSYGMYMLRNRMDADDITQEVFIRLWRNIDNFNVGSAGSYIMKITHNLCLDYIKKRKLSLSREYAIDDYFEETHADNHNENNPQSSAHWGIMSVKIKDAIYKLPDNLKSVFVLYEIEGYKYTEISKALDMPLNTVKVYLMRARQKLQEELKEFKEREKVYD